MFQRNNTTQKEYLEQENIIISTFQSCKSHTVLFRLSYSLLFYGFSVSMQYKIIDLKLGKIVMDLCIKTLHGVAVSYSLMYHYNKSVFYSVKSTHAVNHKIHRFDNCRFCDCSQENHHTQSFCAFLYFE